MFLCKRGRPNVGLDVSFLSTRTGKSIEQDYDKLVRLLSFILTARNVSRSVTIVEL